jgi:hypothetical protein
VPVSAFERFSDELGVGVTGGFLLLDQTIGELKLA